MLEYDSMRQEKLSTRNTIYIILHHTLNMFLSDIWKEHTSFHTDWYTNNICPYRENASNWKLYIRIFQQVCQRYNTTVLLTGELSWQKCEVQHKQYSRLRRECASSGIDTMFIIQSKSDIVYAWITRQRPQWHREENTISGKWQSCKYWPKKQHGNNIVLEKIIVNFFV